MAEIRDFYITVGTNRPSIAAVLLDDLGNKMNLAGATVQFSMRLPTATTAKGGAAVVTDAANGGVRYDWTLADTSAAGVYLAKWYVTYPSGASVAFPNKRSLLIEVGRRV